MQDIGPLTVVPIKHPARWLDQLPVAGTLYSAMTSRSASASSV